MLGLRFRGRSLPLLAIIGAFTLNFILIGGVFGATSEWVNDLGGSFDDTNNWTLGAPGTSDSAEFNIPGEYVINFNDSVANRAAVIETGRVTFDISVNENYTLTNNSFSLPGLKIGTEAGSAATLFVSTGALRSFIKLGTKSEARGEITLTSAGTSEGELFIGERGYGLFTIEPGTSHSGDTAVGLLEGAEGELNITGAGASLSGGTSIGFGGTGTVNILDGGKMLGVRGRSVGISPSGIGILNIRGTESVVNFRNIVFGQYGSGELNVTDGGTLSGSSLGLAEFVEFGGSDSGTGSGLVTGVTSSLSTGGHIAVGVDGYGNLVVENGASMASKIGYIGLTSTGNGAVLIDNATWTINDEFYIGGSTFDTGASGKLDVVNNGSVSSNGDTKVWQNGVLNLAGGELNTNHIDIHGLVSVDDGSTLDSNSEVIIHRSGKVFLTGTLNGNLVNEGILITAPENVSATPHIANIDGNFAQTSAGILNIAIYGPGQTDVAKLVVSGDINSEGEIMLVFANSFVPEIGMMFDIYDSNSAKINELNLVRTSEPSLGARYKDVSIGLIEIVPIPISIPVTSRLFLIIFVSLTLWVFLTALRYD